jgi:hypothetical protein
VTALIAAARAIDEYTGAAVETDREDAIAVPLRLLRALHKALQGAA